MVLVLVLYQYWSPGYNGALNKVHHFETFNGADLEIAIAY